MAVRIRWLSAWDPTTELYCLQRSNRTFLLADCCLSASGLDSPSRTPSQACRARVPPTRSVACAICVSQPPSDPDSPKELRVAWIWIWLKIEYLWRRRKQYSYLLPHMSSLRRQNPSREQFYRFLRLKQLSGMSTEVRTRKSQSLLSLVWASHFSNLALPQ